MSTLSLGLRFSAFSQSDQGEPFNKTELERYLRTARVVSVQKSAVGGKTAPWVVQLHDGKIARRGFFKHVHRSRPSPLADSYQYEIAAYELDKLLDFNIVPPVVERAIEKEKGSLQVFLEDCITERDRKKTNIQPPNPKRFQESLDEIRVFENLVYNKCQNLEDTHIHKTTWKVCRVDFSESFAPSPDLIPGCEITFCSERIFQNLRNLDLPTLQSVLSPYLNADEIKALLERRNKILEKLEGLQK